MQGRGHRNGLEIIGFCTGGSLEYSGISEISENVSGDAKPSVRLKSPSRDDVDIDADVEPNPLAGAPVALADAERRPHQAEMAFGAGGGADDCQREGYNNRLRDAAQGQDAGRGIGVGARLSDSSACELRLGN
jgi:hypothetical protein